MKIEEQERAKYDDVAPDLRGGALRLESGGRPVKRRKTSSFPLSDESAVTRTGSAHSFGTADLCQYL